MTNNPFLTDIVKTVPQDSVAQFIGQIQDKHIENYPSFQKAQLIAKAMPDKDYVRRYFMKKAKYEFVLDLTKQLQASPKAGTEWGKQKLQFLSRVRDTIRNTMTSDSAFAVEEQKRQSLKREEQERERRRLNTWV